MDKLSKDVTQEEKQRLVRDSTEQSQDHYDLPFSVNKTVGSQEYQAYRTRWYVLCIFVLGATSQLCLWNTWGPIAATAKAVFGWTEADIALITNWGCITFVASAFLYSWLMDVKGLKVSFTLGAACLFVGTGIRCIPVAPVNMKWVVHVGQIMIGFAGPVMMAAPALLSATWFPPHQRTTSTAIAASASYLGPAVAYLICPAIVSEVQSSNGSVIPNDSFSGDDIDPKVRQHHIDEIHTLMYIEFGVMTLLFLCVLLYFPARPRSPPSASADTKRTNFKDGVFILVTSLHFWLPALGYGISNGVFYAWQSQLVVIFHNAQDVDQDTSGWIGFFANIAGVLGAISFGRLIDYTGGKMKFVLIILIICGSGFATWFVLLCIDAIYFNTASLYVACIAFGFCINAMVPIYFEMTIEGMYPVAEGIVTCLMTWIMNLLCGAVLLILMVPNIAVSWLNWAALSGTIFGLPLLIIYKEQYNRLTLDVEAESQLTTEDN